MQIRSDVVKLRIRWLPGTILAAGLCLSTTPSALAECSGQPNRWPAFSEVAPSAERILVGTVMGPSTSHEGGPLYLGLDVRVDEVLRGSAAERLEVNALQSGLPRVGDQACRQSAYLYARVGDVIAFAFDGRSPRVANPVNTAAWIEGRPHDNVPGPQLLTLDEVRYFASLPDTATVGGDSPVPALPGPSGGQLLLLILTTAGGLAIGRRLRGARAP
jgi:hypothetical protein